MSNYHSVIEHRANYHFIPLQEDYLAICSQGQTSPHCKALILSILENWLNTKQESEYIYLSIPQWIKFTYMLYERNVITECLWELMDQGLIDRRPIRMFEQNTFEYALCVENVQALIKALPEKEPRELYPRLDAYTIYRENARNQARAKRAEKKEQEENTEGVREKSPTSHDMGVREKSQGVREKSPLGYVKNHRGYVKNQRNIYITNNSNTKDITNKDIPPHSSQLPAEESNTANADCLSISQPLFDISEYQEQSGQPQGGQGVTRRARGRKKSGQAVIHYHPAHETASQSFEGENTATSGKPADRPEKPAKPELPPDTAPWPSSETMVAMQEAKQGRYYGEKTRKEEVNEAKQILKMRYNGQPLSRADIQRGIDDMFSWPFWNGKAVKPMLKYLRRDDKIINVLAELDNNPGRNNGSQPGKPVPGQSIAPGTLVEDEQGSFTILTTLQLSRLPVEQRRAYNKRYQLVVNAYRAAQKQAVNS
jgi:hypothetical protein